MAKICCPSIGTNSAATKRPDAPSSIRSGALRSGLFVLLGLLAVVAARAVQLETTQGAAFRAAAAKPLRHVTTLPASRGRILVATARS